MKTRLLLCAVALVSIAPAQDPPNFHKALAAFKKAGRIKDVAARRPAVDALIACKDPRAIDDLVSAAMSAVKDLGKLEKQIKKTGQKIGDAMKAVDKQADKGRTISVSTFQAAQKKAAPLMRELQKLMGRKEALISWRDILLEGCGTLLDAVEADARGRAIVSQTSKLERARDHEEQIARLDAIAASKSDEARDALIGLAAKVDDGVVRVGVIDALAMRRDVKTIGALAAALKDEVWPVRVSAARGLGAITSPDCIPPLLAALEWAEGRFLEEVIESLVSHSGITFHDNDTLWRQWWKDEERDFRTVLGKIEADNPATRLGGLLTVGQKGMLLGARRVLAREGVGPRLAHEHDAEPVPLDGDEVAVALTAARRDAVGQAFTRLPAGLRDGFVERFLVRPFRRAETQAKRERVVGLLGGVRTEKIRELLIKLVGKASVTDASGVRLGKDDRDALRVAAAEALGRQGHKSVAAPLRTALTGFKHPTPLRMAAVKALRTLAMKESIDPLIDGLKISDAPEVVNACRQALTEMSGKSHPDVNAWRRWWDTARADFKVKGAPIARGPRAEPAKAEGKGGTRFYGIETRSKHLVFILDRSGSMMEMDSSGTGRKMDVAKAELIKAIESLPDDATFNIIFYNSTWDVWKKGMTVATPANRKRAVEWVKGIDHVGATNIFDPLERAFQLAGRGTHDKAYKLALDTIFFMSDGLANRGRIIDPRHILAEIERMNALKKVRIHTIGIGDNHDIRLMKGLADLSGGTYVAK